MASPESEGFKRLEEDLDEEKQIKEGATKSSTPTCLDQAKKVYSCSPYKALFGIVQVGSLVLVFLLFARIAYDLNHAGSSEEGEDASPKEEGEHSDAMGEAGSFVRKAIEAANGGTGTDVAWDQWIGKMKIVCNVRSEEGEVAPDVEKYIRENIKTFKETTITGWVTMVGAWGTGMWPVIAAGILMETVKLKVEIGSSPVKILLLLPTITALVGHGSTAFASLFNFWKEASAFWGQNGQWNNDCSFFLSFKTLAYKDTFPLLIAATTSFLDLFLTITTMLWLCGMTVYGTGGVIWKIFIGFVASIWGAIKSCFTCVFCGICIQCQKCCAAGCSCGCLMKILCFPCVTFYEQVLCCGCFSPCIAAVKALWQSIIAFFTVYLYPFVCNTAIMLALIPASIYMLSGVAGVLLIIVSSILIFFFVFFSISGVLYYVSFGKMGNSMDDFQSFVQGSLKPARDKFFNIATIIDDLKKFNIALNPPIILIFGFLGLLTIGFCDSISDYYLSFYVKTSFDDLFPDFASVENTPVPSAGLVPSPAPDAAELPPEFVAVDTYVPQWNVVTRMFATGSALYYLGFYQVWIVVPSAVEALLEKSYIAGIFNEMTDFDEFVAGLMQLRFLSSLGSGIVDWANNFV